MRKAAETSARCCVGFRVWALGVRVQGLMFRPDPTQTLSCNHTQTSMYTRRFESLIALDLNLSTEGQSIETQEKLHPKLYALPGDNSPMNLVLFNDALVGPACFIEAGAQGLAETRKVCKQKRQRHFCLFQNWFWATVLSTCGSRQRRMAEQRSMTFRVKGLGLPGPRKYVK